MLENDILIGVTSEGYGTATDTFRTVGTPIEGINNIKRTVNSYVDFGFDVKDYQHTVNIFGLQNIPSNASSFFTYQLSIIDDDGVRPDGSTIEIHPDCTDQSDDEGSGDPDNEITHNTDLEFESRILYSVDCMDDGMLYPVQSKDNQYSDGYVQQINVISSDEDLAQIENGGKIVSSYSFGTSQIHTGQKTGPLTISASVNGVGTGSFETNVVNPFRTKRS